VRTLGSYIIIDELGRGGMGVVYRARARDGRTVAVKVLPAFIARGDSLDRFGREVRLLGSLGEDQGFVPLLDSGSSPTGPFFVMPLIEGGTLRNRIEAGPLTVADAVALGIALGRTLGVAHRAGIVHRDLKPENILYTKEGRPLVSDLGLAKHFSSDDSALSISLSKTGEVRGTVGYMAPEQVNDAKSAGPPADVFALGAMLYECLASERPFEGDNPHATLALTMAGKFTPLARRRRDVPPGVAAVVERALASAPEARFADGAAFADALASGARAPRARRRLPLVVALLAVAGAAAAAALALPKRREEPPAPPPPPPPPSVPTRAFPTACQGFSESKHLRLASLLGSYKGRHGAPIAALAFVPRSDLLATAGADKRIVFWSKEGDEVRAIDAASPLSSLAFTPDGRSILAGDARGAVEVLSFETGARTLELAASARSAVVAVSASEDGKLAATAAASGTWRTFDLATGHVVADAVGAPNPSFLGFRPGKDELVLGGHDGLLVLDDASKSAPIAARNLLAPEPVTASALSGDGSRAVTGDAGGGIVEWGFDRDEPLRKTHVPVAGGVTCVALSRKGELCLAGGGDGSAHVVDLASGSIVATLEGCEGSVRAAAFTPDDRRVVLAGDDGRLHAWELVKRGDPPRRVWPDGGHRGVVTALAVASGGRVLSGTVGDATCRIWDGKRETEIGRLQGRPVQGNVNGIAVSPDGRTVATVAHDRSARFFDLETREEIWTVGGFDNNVLAVAFGPDGRAVVGSDEGIVRILDPVKRLEVRTKKTPGNWIRSVAWLPGDDRVAACGFEGSLRVFAAADGAEVWRLEGVKESGQVAALAPGRVLCSWGDGSVHVVDVAGRRDVVSFQAHARGEPRLLVLPGKRLVTADQEEASVKLWDLESRTELDRVVLASAHDAPVALAASEDGRILWVGTARGVVLGFTVDR
jgi:WD40 repeat protein/serine/threonine protein kinase